MHDTNKDRGREKFTSVAAFSLKGESFHEDDTDEKHAHYENAKKCRAELF